MIKIHNEKTLEERQNESKQMLTRYPGRVCIYVEKHRDCKIDGELSKKKFLIPEGIQVDQFIFMIRQKLVLKKEEALFFYVKNRLMTGTKPLSELYKKYKSKDNFLYVTYTSENCFG